MDEERFSSQTVKMVQLARFCSWSLKGMVGFSDDIWVVLQRGGWHWFNWQYCVQVFQAGTWVHWWPQTGTQVHEPALLWDDLAGVSLQSALLDLVHKSSAASEDFRWQSGSSDRDGGSMAHWWSLMSNGKLVVTRGYILSIDGQVSQWRQT